MDYTGKTVLLTGASGFIGSHLAEELVTCGASAVSVRRIISFRFFCQTSNSATQWGELLKAAGIQTSIHYPALHHFRAFRHAASELHLPKTEEFAARELTLPLYPTLTSEQVDAIACAVLKNIAVASI